MHSAQRTLVKSPPELWSELSDPDGLARRLGTFGEIRITRLEPEATVAWEGDGARGTVRLEPAGWGTRVTLTAELDERDAPAEAGKAAAAAGLEAEAEPSAETEPIAPAARPADAEPLAGAGQSTAADPPAHGGPTAAEPLATAGRSTDGGPLAGAGHSTEADPPAHGGPTAAEP
ncbi:MAG: hypothetical protein E6G10_22260, partial [Actinobacteria bacterium]